MPLYTLLFLRKYISFFLASYAFNFHFIVFMFQWFLNTQFNFITDNFHCLYINKYWWLVICNHIFSFYLISDLFFTASLFRFITNRIPQIIAHLFHKMNNCEFIILTFKIFKLFFFSHPRAIHKNLVS